MFRKSFTTSIFKKILYNYGQRNVASKSEPLKDVDRIFTNIYGRHDWHLNSAMLRGDWYKTKEMLERGPTWITEQVVSSGIRGRGGANFPLGKKLLYMQRRKSGPPRYLIVNGAEGEPGTCKDREIMRHEPQKVIEGTLLLGRAVNATEAWIFVRGKFYREACNLQLALVEAYKMGLLGINACGSGFDFDIYVQRGGGNYISGEETALINCLMSKQSRPSRKPPYPAEKGLWSQPTVLLNFETVSLVPTICRRGTAWYSKLGVWPHSPGAKLFNITGHVERPCTVEENHGISLRELIERHAGGVKGGWDNLLAVIPGGSSTPMLNKQVCDKVTLDVESMTSFNSSLGTGAVIVLDKSHDIIEAVTRILYFYKKTSCHQCSSCRGQSTWAYQYSKQFVSGIGQVQEIDWLWEISEWAPQSTICAFSNANAAAIQGFLRNFRDVVEKRLGLKAK